MISLDCELLAEEIYLEHVDSQLNSKTLFSTVEGFFPGCSTFSSHNRLQACLHHPGSTDTGLLPLLVPKVKG